jgi:hypothetical protein
MANLKQWVIDRLKRIDAVKVARFTTTLIGLVIVGLFVQKSQGNSSIATLTLLAVASVGVVLIANSLGQVIQLFRNPRAESDQLSRRTLIKSTLLSLLGVAFVVVSLDFIDYEDTDYLQEPVLYRDNQAGKQVKELVEDSDTLALRNLILMQGEKGDRLKLVIVNRRQTSVVANEIRIMGVSGRQPATCGSNTSYNYKFEGSVTISRDGTIEGARLAETGSAYSVAASGRASGETCYGLQLYSLSAPVSIALDPLGSATLALDVDNEFPVAVLEGMDYVSVSIAASESAATISRTIGDR